MYIKTDADPPYPEIEVSSVSPYYPDPPGPTYPYPGRESKG